MRKTAYVTSVTNDTSTKKRLAVIAGLTTSALIAVGAGLAFKLRKHAD